MENLYNLTELKDLMSSKCPGAVEALEQAFVNAGGNSGATHFVFVHDLGDDSVRVIGVCGMFEIKDDDRWHFLFTERATIA